jgi:hypothetical protein
MRSRANSIRCGGLISWSRTKSGAELSQMGLSSASVASGLFGSMTMTMRSRHLQAARRFHPESIPTGHHHEGAIPGILS